MDTARKVLKMKPNVDRKTLEKMGYSGDADPQVALIIVMAMAQKAMKGDVRSAALLMEMIGEDATSVAAQERLELEREKMRLNGIDQNNDSLEKAKELLGVIDSAF